MKTYEEFISVSSDTYVGNINEVSEVIYKQRKIIK